MCRLAAFAPGTTKKQAIDILENMVNDNIDGTGYAYVQNGEFVLHKYPIPLKTAIKRKQNFLSHMPHNGWTLVHLRKASVGSKIYDNCHPFISTDNEVVGAHNGTLHNIGLLQAYLRTVSGFVSDTDSACAIELISRGGMESFVDELDWGGVFITLKKSGVLEVGKVSGDLCLHRLDDGRLIIASEFNDEKYKNITVSNGYFKFDAGGKDLLDHTIKHFPHRGPASQIWHNTQGVLNRGAVHYQQTEAYCCD